MKIAILGYEGQGQTAYQYWNRDGNTLVVCDMDENKATPPDAEARLGKDYLKSLGEFDLLVRTPALHPRDITAANPDSPNILDKVTTVTNEFFRVCPAKNIIGVTGTKGKGTTSTLIAKMLEASGRKVHLGGNIGIPPLEMLNPPAGGSIQLDDWVVLELANFQLIDLKHSPPLAVCLMVVPEHLNWHEDIDEYIRAKQQLFRWQEENDKAIYFAGSENSQKIVSISKGTKIPYYKSPGAEVINDEVVIDGQTICPVSEIKLLGKHNWQNACAAVTAVWQVTQNVEAIRSVLISMQNLPFRIEFRKEVNGVSYYNDSYASAPDATLAALEAITKPKVLIIGGFDRGLGLSGLAKGILDNASIIRKIVLVGASAKQVARELSSAGYDNYVHCPEKDMSSIVRFATEHAHKGDALVLSPGFASFDMFKNFEDRGRQFNEAVEQL